LHLIRYSASELDQVIDTVNATGYGLTLGIHSRIDANIKTIRQGAKVGNIYINRNMIGAVVGVQPFGGMGLSGTGPKAGGPDYCAALQLNKPSLQIPQLLAQCQFTGQGFTLKSLLFFANFVFLRLCSGQASW